ncbi:methyl-accepting chemotaxis protein [Limnobacter thiooxidans]|nr:methyl-accepting chemotaxis protein [Limnobacter thiooxidans]
MFTIKRLMSNRRLGQKFLMIGAMMAALMLVLSWQAISSLSALRGTVLNEHQGVDEVQRLTALISKVQVHRGLSNILLNGDTEAQSKIQPVAAEISLAWTGFQTNLPAGWTQSRELASQSQRDWTDLQGKLRSLSPADSFKLHSELIANLVLLLKQVSDDSELTLDPVLSSYYLMSVINFELPQLQESIAQIRGQVAGLIASGSVDRDSMLMSNMRLGMVDQSLHAVARSYSKVGEDSEGLPRTQVDLFNALQKQASELKALLVRVEQKDPAVTPMVFFNTATGMIQTSISLAQANSLMLQDILTQRADGYSFDLLLSTVALVLGIGMAGITAWLTVADLKSRVTQVLEQTARLVQGDLREFPRTTSQDEIGEISDALNALRLSQHTFAKAMQLSAADLSDAADVLRKQSQEVKGSASSQSDSSSSVAATVEEMTVSITQISDNVRSTRQVAESVGVSARAGFGGVAAVTDSMQDINSSSVELTGLIKNLEKSSVAISGIVDTIGSIAKQTNLLALNAAIEAARAGEEGRGFAVVADEVRGLAEKTAGSTQEIAELISSLQLNTRNAAELVWGWGTVLSTGLEHAQGAKALMGEIDQNSKNAEVAIGEIDRAMAEQSEASLQIAQQVESIARTTEESQHACFRLDELVVNIQSVCNIVQSQSARFKLQA